MQDGALYLSKSSSELSVVTAARMEADLSCEERSNLHVQFSKEKSIEEDMSLMARTSSISLQFVYRKDKAILYRVIAHTAPLSQRPYRT